MCRSQAKEPVLVQTGLEWHLSLQVLRNLTAAFQLTAAVRGHQLIPSLEQHCISRHATSHKMEKS